MPSAVSPAQVSACALCSASSPDMVVKSGRKAIWTAVRASTSRCLRRRREPCNDRCDAFAVRTAVMGKPLRALLVEDSEDDAELLIRELRKGGYDVSHRRVETAETMRAALTHQSWDIVISDYCMPTFDAPSAIAVLADSGFDI